MKISFNLVDHPWVPVRLQTGQAELMSLHQLFEESDRVAVINAQPHERISLLRLLICVTQATLGAQESLEAQQKLSKDFEKAIANYLDKVRNHFELFGSGERFLQVFVKDKEPVNASKLNPHLATGNNPTLFDHAGQDAARAFEPHTLALALLTFQNFYPLYGAGYRGKGPCVDQNMAHTFVVGKSLKETILNNCLTAELIDELYRENGLGRPLWELEPRQKDFSELATNSYLGRLVPRHRNLWLLEDGSGFRLSTEGLEYPRFEETREPHATVVVVGPKKDTRRLLPSRLERAVWRDLHCITVYEKSASSASAAPLNVALQAENGSEHMHLWVGGLVTDFKAKVYDTVESSLTVPMAMFEPLGRATYAAGVDYAAEVSRRLYGAIKLYGSTMKHEQTPFQAAQRHYWNAIELSVADLLALVQRPELRQGLEFEGIKDPWSQAVHQAAQQAFEMVCPRQTPRQLQAYAAGWRMIISRPNKAKKTTK